MTLFDERITTVGRRPCGMLRDRGVLVVDDPRVPRLEAARHVADWIAYGAWCDPLAWASRLDPFVTALAEEVVRLELPFDDVGPMVVDTLPL